MSQLDELLERFKNIAEGKEVSQPGETFRRYTITNFRGGIGKSTLAFNLAWELSRREDVLLLDVCPQANFTQSLLGEIPANSATIYDALLPMVMPGAQKMPSKDLVTSVPAYCDPFKRGKEAFIVPGSKELFLFPSLLYTQLSAASQLGKRTGDTTKSILNSISSILDDIQKTFPHEKVLIDTSPFFGGGTHLAWVAADALIVPARVDQHSIEALRLTLSMLRDNSMDFLRLNQQAGIDRVPKIHAIVMTHCGWSRQTGFTPDRSTQAYLKQALDVANEYSDLLTSENPVQAIHLLDDFHSAGRISGTKRIPLARLHVGEQHTIQGQRMEVNQSLSRYIRELKSLAAIL